jgi:7-cyano-7-deazaguanine synthase
MALLFFSGGIDSSTLAFDIAQHPWRYGVRGSEKLFLLTSTPGDVRTKKRQLQPLVAALGEKSTLDIDHQLVSCPLASEVQEDVAVGGMQILNSVQCADYDPDQAALPYSPGLTLWLASMAVSVLMEEKEPPWGYKQAFFGFMGDGSYWKALEEGEIRSHDTSPDFLGKLNVAVEASGEPVLFRAPYFDGRLDKAMIVRLGLEVGVPFGLTSSCILGWGKNCGLCNQCIRRQAVFRSLHVEA